MQPFTFDQAIVVAIVFILGLLIGMFLLAGSKWKRRYKAEQARVRELEVEVQRLGRESREFATLRDRADRHPARGPLAAGAAANEPIRHTGPHDARLGPDGHRPGDIGRDWKPYRADRDSDGVPDGVDRRS